jgi:enoyl-CoA hydratase
MTDSPLLIKTENGVATLTLNRPEALNALNARLRRALIQALSELDARVDIRVIILAGAGRAFCAGLDVRELSASERDVSAEVAQADIGAALSALETPVIAAVNGPAVTGGFEIAMACDMVVAAESAWFQDTHASIGLLPGWGLSQRLQRVIGANRAREIALTARRVTATEGAEMGFVNRVVPDDDLAVTARAMADAVAQWNGAHLRNIKHLMNRGGEFSLAEALEFERCESRRLNGAVMLGAERQD